VNPAYSLVTGKNGSIRIVKWRFLLAAALPLSCAAPGGGPNAAALAEFRGILHCHSLYSHDSEGTYEEILAAAKAARVDFVCITDHPPKGDAGLSLREGWKGLRDGVLFIQGHELAGANLLAIGIREPIAPGGTPREKIAAIHAQGGVAIVSHPEEVADWEPYLTADGMEIYNLHAAWKRHQGNFGFLAKALALLKRDPERLFTLVQELDPAVIARWEEINKTRRFVGVAGNDAHQNVKIGSLQADPYERAFRFVSTHVWAEELTERAVLAALKRGHCYVEFGATPWSLNGTSSDKPAGRLRRVDTMTPEGLRPWRVYNEDPSGVTLTRPSR
jgi:predicted metal-dependent phosphoesterase TrpH